MRYVGRDFPIMDPTEQIDLTLDFSNDAARGDCVSSATWTVTVQSGTDATPSARAIGTTSYCRQEVTQRMGGLLTGVKYKVAAVATMNSGEVLGLFSYVTGRA